MARHTAIWGRVQTVEESAAEIEAVTRDDVLRFAEGIVGSAATALALYGPVNRAPTLDRLRERLAA
jgi:hypothetical protein